MIQLYLTRLNSAYLYNSLEGISIQEFAALTKAYITEVLDRLTRIEERTDAWHAEHSKALVLLDRKLFGNGQAGVLEKHERRLHRLELALAMCTGGGWLLLIFLKMTNLV